MVVDFHVVLEEDGSYVGHDLQKHPCIIIRTKGT
jgi:hypothetical protein